MPELSRRERKKKDTYDKIFASAMHLFRKQGFEATSVEQITQYADVGKGTFYNYFPTKEAVVLEFSRQANRELVDSRRGQSGAGVRDRLTALLADWAGLMARNRELAWVAVHNREGAEYDLSLHYGIQAILAAGQREGEIASTHDPAFLTESLEGMIIQRFISWYVANDGDLQAKVKQVLDIFWEVLADRRKQA